MQGKRVLGVRGKEGIRRWRERGGFFMGGFSGDLVGNLWGRFFMGGFSGI